MYPFFSVLPYGNIHSEARALYLLIFNTHTLSLMNFLDGGVDCRVWRASRDGVFSVSSFFSAIISSSPSPSPLSSIWALKAPPRVIAFGWIALRGEILTMDNLHRRKKIIVNACPMCLADEAVDHLLLRCRVAQERNARCFKGSKSSVEEIVNKMKHTVTSWVSVLPQFQGILLEMICRNWREVSDPLLPT